MKKLVGVAVAIVLLLAGLAIQWRYDQVGGTLIRTNRFSGTVERYSSTLGWVRQGQTTAVTPEPVEAPAQAVAVAQDPAPAPTPCPTPDPKNPYWHYSQFGACR